MDDKSLYDFERSIFQEGLRDNRKCRKCGGEVVGPSLIQEMPNPDGTDTSAAYVQLLCGKGHTVKSLQCSWKFLETLQKMAEEKNG